MWLFTKIYRWCNNLLLKSCLKTWLPESTAISYWRMVNLEKNVKLFKSFSRQFFFYWTILYQHSCSTLSFEWRGSASWSRGSDPAPRQVKIQWNLKDSAICFKIGYFVEVFKFFRPCYFNIWLLFKLILKFLEK